MEDDEVGYDGQLLEGVILGVQAIELQQHEEAYKEEHRKLAALRAKQGNKSMTMGEIIAKQEAAEQARAERDLALLAPPIVEAEKKPDPVAGKFPPPPMTGGK